MTHRERVLKTFQFERPDRLAWDLMEGVVWPQLTDYFKEKHGVHDPAEVVAFLDTDFRWVDMIDRRPESQLPRKGAPDGDDAAFSKAVAKGPLSEARSIAEVEAYEWPDPAWWQAPDLAQARRQWPEHALALRTGWMPLFWTACEAFGVEQALINLVTAPRLFETFVRRQHEFYLDILSRGVEAGRGSLDICWLGDDFASQQAMLLSPEHWRRFIRPCLQEQVRLVRDCGMHVLYHSCGAVRSVLPDLIDMGVNGMIVFQTTAAGMDVRSIAKDFGGRLVFYGGMDVQHLLSYGTPEEVRAKVKSNWEAFADCGGYIVTNSHHCVPPLRGRPVLYQLPRFGPDLTGIT